MENIKKKVPERKCVGCGEKKPKKELIRIVRSADTEAIEVDVTGKKDGRGAYICKSPLCLKKARKKLAAHLGKEIPDEVYGRLEAEIEKTV